MPGDDWQKFANLRAYYAFMWGYPGKKLLFMGQEFAQGAEWNDAHGLDWGSSTIAPHHGMQRWCATSTALYRDTPALHQRDCEGDGFEWLIADDAQNSVFAWLRKAPATSRRSRSISNFTPVPRARLPVGRCRMPGAGARSSTPTPPSTAAASVGNMGGVTADAGDRARQPASA